MLTASNCLHPLISLNIKIKDIPILLIEVQRQENPTIKYDTSKCAIDQAVKEFSALKKPQFHPQICQSLSMMLDKSFK